MELYQLRTFAAVAHEGHLTRAAERLHVSQPAVSGQIKALEQHFDVRLFERSTNGMALTPAGRELLAHAHKVISAADELRRVAQRLNAADAVVGRVRIGTVSDPDTNRLGDLLAAANHRHPGLDLELQHEVSGAALGAVRDGDLEASFYYGAAPGDEFVSVPLRSLTYRVVAPAHWLPRVLNASLADLATLPWVLTPSISTHNALTRQLFAEQGVTTPQPHVEADNETVISSLVVAGVGVSLMREESALAREAAGEICVWPRGRMSTTLWFVARADRVDDPLVRSVLELVRQVWAPGAPVNAPSVADVATAD